MVTNMGIHLLYKGNFEDAHRIVNYLDQELECIAGVNDDLSIIYVHGLNMNEAVRIQQKVKDEFGKRITAVDTYTEDDEDD